LQDVDLSDELRGRRPGLNMLPADLRAQQCHRRTIDTRDGLSSKPCHIGEQAVYTPAAGHHLGQSAYGGLQIDLV
jgi:hypothetical protein